MFLWDYRVTQATHQNPLRHTIDCRADQFTLSRFEIHSNTCNERKPDKAPANFTLQPICQKDAPSIYLSWPKYWATSISREIQLDSTDSTVSCSWDLLRRSQDKACGTPLVKPKNNLPPGEERALKELINNKEIILKKEDKGTTTVVINRENKITEGQIQLDDRNNYQPLDKPMVGDTFQRVKHLINSLRQAGCIDEMTAKWFNQTPDPPRIPVFYTLTKIHKPTLVGRPIISGCDGLTERLSSFPSGVDKVPQPIAQIQESYLKDTTHFIRFIESTRVPKNAFLVSMDVTRCHSMDVNEYPTGGRNHYSVQRIRKLL